MHIRPPTFPRFGSDPAARGRPSSLRLRLLTLAKARLQAALTPPTVGRVSQRAGFAVFFRGYTHTAHLSPASFFGSPPKRRRDPLAPKFQKLEGILAGTWRRAPWGGERRNECPGSSLGFLLGLFFSGYIRNTVRIVETYEDWMPSNIQRQSSEYD